MLKRRAAFLIQQKLKNSPAVALLGPRQSGKTTLAKTLSKTYFDLEQPEDRLKLDLSWEELIPGPDLIILDEAQSWPDIFPRLRGAIDADRQRRGRFLILGSVSPILMKNVSESLAGRLALCELTPLMFGEISSQDNEDALWLRGGFPEGGILNKEQFPAWQRDYLTLLAQRDLPHWGLPAKPQTTERLFKMLAACQGQVWNASEIGKSLGLSYHTVNSYLDYLQNAYLVTLLPPYCKNIRKRVTKKPKIYWQDTGLLHSLLGVRSSENLLSQPWVGSSWEGWIIHQILFALKAEGKIFDAYYFRTSDGYELDLILNLPKERWAFEMKLTGSPDSNDFKRLTVAADLIQAGKRMLISRTRKTISTSSGISTNLSGCLSTILG